MQIQPFNMAWQYSNYLLQTAKQKPQKMIKQMKSDVKWKSLQHKLTELYLSNCSSTANSKNLFMGSNLLEKLVAKEKLNCLVVNLYPGNEGYSLMLKTRTGSDTETIRLPYEEGELLQYIDNEELPPLLVDLLERSQANIFYNGCVIVEVRDYRRTSNPSTCDYHHVLLKPTTQSLVCDVGLLTNDSQKWTWEDRQALESALLLATSEPLCLDPSVAVSLVANRLQHRKQLLAQWPLKRMAKKHSQATVNKKRKFEHCIAPKNLRLYDFLAKRKNKLCSQPLVNLKLSKQVVDVWKQKEVELSVPEVIEVEKFAKAIEKPKGTPDSIPVTEEEYIMEVERSPGKIQYTQVSILQRPIDEQYFGKLFLGRDSQQNGTNCCFPLGNRDNADKYIDQFTKIFTEEGRKSVKITHVVSGQPPKIIYTPGAKEMMENNQSSLAATSTTSTATTVASLISVHNESSDSSHQNKKLSHPPKLVPCTTNTTPSTVTSPKSSIEEDSAKMNASTNETSTHSNKRPRSPSPVTSNNQGSSSPVSTESSFARISTGPNRSGVLSTGNLAPSLNISGLELAQNLGLHNLVSIAAVPLSLTMVNSGQSTFLTSPSGMVVGSVPTLVHTTSTTTTTTSSLTVPPLQVAAVTGGIPSESNASPTNASSGNTRSSAVLVPSGVISSPPSVLQSSGSMLSIPLDPQNLAAHIMASGLKGSPQDLRNVPPVSLLQVSGSQQSVPLIGALQRSLTQSRTSSSTTSTNSGQSRSPTTSSSAKAGSPSSAGTPPPNISSGMAVAPALVQLAIQKQMQPPARRQQSSSSSSRSKNKKKTSESSK